MFYDIVSGVAVLLVCLVILMLLICLAAIIISAKTEKRQLDCYDDMDNPGAMCPGEFDEHGLLLRCDSCPFFGPDAYDVEDDYV